MHDLSRRPASPTSADRTTPAAACEIAATLRHREPATLHDLDSIIHHPRSLARPVASWRPPSKATPRAPGVPALSIAVTRHRVGATARQRVLEYGSTRTPAYLISLRITDPRGGRVSSLAAEAWVRALVGESHVRSVHEIGAGQSPTYVWMADGHFTPVRSPASLYAGFSDAA